MNKNVRNFLKAELTVAFQYLDRSYFVVSSNLSIKSNLNLKNKVEQFYYDLHKIITKYIELDEIKFKIGSDDYKKFIKSSYEICLNLLNFNISEKYDDLYKNIFNYYYDKAYYFHVISLDQKELNIVAPRSHFVKPVDTQDLEVKKYQINWEIIEQLKDAKNLFVSTLQDRREDCFDQAVLEGHNFIYKKQYNLALKAFEKARNFKEDAEVLNLIGWAYSFLEKLDLAEKFALKAIRKDPDYGAAYNDLGSYLLTKGKAKEALEWFSMAKKSLNYQNREYPYINAGRTYLLLKDYPKALNEFSYALTLAPYHEELHETVSNLHKTIERSKVKTNLPNSSKSIDENPPIF